VFSAKCTFGIIPPLLEVKQLMFSKENSSEEISFTQQPQTGVRPMIPRLKKKKVKFIRKNLKKLLDDHVST
jgi:hypothetical protein